MLFFCFTTTATHIVGGELNYRHIPNTNDYEISLIVYRDCYNGIPQLDNPAYIFIYDDFNNLVTTMAMVLDSAQIIPSTVNSPCFIPPVDVCYQRSFYQPQIITLPPSNGGYQLAYQRCCRNNTILNIVDPGGTGATFYAFIPPTSLFSRNSNPVFDSLPPPFICDGLPFVFDHSATDIDSTLINNVWVHDSIVYELCEPFTGADASNPIPTPNNLPVPPPYVPISWQAPFSLSNVVSANPPFVIDANSGIITATPNLQGQYVLAVCAKEFRNGIYLSTTRRDFQLNVVPCPTLVVAAIQNPLIVCGSNTVTFQNFSINASSYDWDFGVVGSLADTSHLFSPTFTYPDTGSYLVTLFAHSAVNFNCKDSTTSIVRIYPDYLPTFTFVKETCTNSVSFTDTSNLDAGNTITWNWNFGDGSTSNQHNPVHLYSPGNFVITFTGTSAKGCIKTVTQQISIPSLLTLSVDSIDPVRCSGECNGSVAINANNGTAPYAFQWNDPLFQNTALADSLCKGNYEVIVIDSNNCADTLSIAITQPLPLSLQLNSTIAYCNGACIGTATATVTGGNGGNNYLWNDSSLQTTAFAFQLCPGVYTVVINDSRNCTITDSIPVLFSDSLPKVEAFTDRDTLYEGQIAQLTALPDTNYVYSWSPSSSLNSSSIPNPLATPTVTTTYLILVTDTNGCTNTDTVRIVVLDIICKEPEIFVPSAFSPNNDRMNDVLLVRGNTMEKVFFALYDRWGEKVFETSDQNIGWDGTYKGEKVQPGVYVFYLEATCWDKQQFFKKGNVTLLK